MARVKAAEPAYASHFKGTSTRQLFESCPWMIMNQKRSSDAAANTLTIDWSLLIYCSSIRRLVNVRYLLNSAVHKHYTGGRCSNEDAAPSAAAGAEQHKSKQHHNRGALLAAAARNAMWLYVRGPSRIGHLRHMLRSGVPVQLKALGECQGRGYEHQPSCLYSVPAQN